MGPAFPLFDEHVGPLDHSISHSGRFGGEGFSCSTRQQAPRHRCYQCLCQNHTLLQTRGIKAQAHKETTGKYKDYTGVDPKHNASTVQPNLTVQLGGLGVAQAALLTPRKPHERHCNVPTAWAAQLNCTLQRPRSGAGCSSDPNIRYYDVPTGQPNLTVCFNSFGVAQAAPRTQTYA